jgi:hypothetical protein
VDCIICGAGSVFYVSPSFFPRQASFHRKEFYITAEWHFCALSRGKVLCDGVAGTVKHIALGYSSWQPYNLQITTPLPLYKWCMGIIKIHNFEYMTSLQYKEEE